MSKGCYDYGIYDYARYDVYLPLWDNILNALKKQTGANYEVTRRQLWLGLSDGTTGWYAESYTESTIEMVIQVKGSRHLDLPGGTLVELDALGLTADAVVDGDEIHQTVGDVYYKVERVEEIYSPGDNFHHRKCHMSLIQSHVSSWVTAAAPTAPKDSRQLMKNYLDGHITATNLTQDNGSTLALFLVAYGFPNYPLIRVFDEKDIDLIFSVMQPTSEAVLDEDQEPYHYLESVPIITSVVDKDGVSHELLEWKAEKELRNVLETYPTGSQLSIERREPRQTVYSGTPIWQQTFIIRYERDTTT